MEPIIKELKCLLEDFNSKDIKKMFDFQFEKFLLQSEGIEGETLSGHFEMLRRVADFFEFAEEEIVEIKE